MGICSSKSARSVQPVQAAAVDIDPSIAQVNNYVEKVTTDTTDTIMTLDTAQTNEKAAFRHSEAIIRQSRPRAASNLSANLRPLVVDHGVSYSAPVERNLDTISPMGRDGSRHLPTEDEGKPVCVHTTLHAVHYKPHTTFHMYICTYAHMHTRTHAHTCTHMHTHTHRSH
jgi:hypothetical protein